MLNSAPSVVHIGWSDRHITSACDARDPMQQVPVADYIRRKNDPDDLITEEMGTSGAKRVRTSLAPFSSWRPR